MKKQIINIKNERDKKMKKYEVKFNTHEIIVKDNTKSMFLSSTIMNKNHITKTDKNSFVINMIAENFRDCLTKARQLYKEASSIEVKEIKQAIISMSEVITKKAA
tara:strand:- start:160 stop:474 length:315 start_codon:yes stop_codon:yes gene_type:complete